jgi:hypothetical protein
VHWRAHARRKGLQPDLQSLHVVVARSSYCNMGQAWPSIVVLVQLGYWVDDGARGACGSGSGVAGSWVPYSASLAHLHGLRTHTPVAVSTLEAVQAWCLAPQGGQQGPKPHQQRPRNQATQKA